MNFNNSLSKIYFKRHEPAGILTASNIVNLIKLFSQQKLTENILCKQ